MPVRRLYEQTLIGALKKKILLAVYSIIVDDTTFALQAYCCLNSFMMSVAPAHGTVYPVNIKYTLNVKRNDTFDHG